MLAVVCEGAAGVFPGTAFAARMGKAIAGRMCAGAKLVYPYLHDSRLGKVAEVVLMFPMGWAAGGPARAQVDA